MRKIFLISVILTTITVSIIITNKINEKVTNVEEIICEYTDSIAKEANLDTTSISGTVKNDNDLNTYNKSFTVSSINALNTAGNETVKSFTNDLKSSFSIFGTFTSSIAFVFLFDIFAGIITFMYFSIKRSIKEKIQNKRLDKVFASLSV